MALDKSVARALDKAMAMYHGMGYQTLMEKREPQTYDATAWLARPMGGDSVTVMRLSAGIRWDGKGTVFTSSIDVPLEVADRLRSVVEGGD